MSKNKITFTAQRAKFLLAVLVTSLITGVAFFWPPMLTQAQGATPESCFDIYDGEIQGYDESCGSNLIIPQTINGQEVIGIRYAAFSDKNLTSVFIPDSVQYIQDRAFSNNQITSLRLSNSIEIIDWSTFGNNQLTSIIIPDSVTKIEGYAFYNNQLTSIIIPSYTTSIGYRAFYNNQIESLELGDSLKYIKARAFMNNKITNINIPNSIETIDYNAFTNNNIISLVFEEDSNLQDIGIGAFANNQLSTVSLPQGIEGIAPWTFAVNNFSEIDLTDNVNYIGMGAFAYNKIAHAPTNFNNNNPNAKWILLEEAYKSTPSQIDNQKNYKRLLTKGLETIYNIFGVFAQGELPEGYRQTPVKLFSNNPEGVFVAKQANAIVLYPYNPEYCFELENGTIINYLKDNNECGEMVSIPNSINGNTIHTIGAQAFENKGISQLYLPSSLTTIQSKAFNQNQITTIQIPNNLISIQELAFANNPGEDALNGKVQGIIQINKDPASVNIAVDANIELMIPPTDESCFGFYNGEIQRYDRNCESDVVIPQTINGQEVIGIGDRAFNEMNLNSVIIPNSVQYIGYQAFTDNQLSKIQLPDSIEYIGSEAFMNNISYNPDYLTEIEAWIDIQIDLAIEENCSGLSGNEYESCKEQVTIELEDYIEQNFLEIYALYLVDVVHYYSNYDQVLAEVMQPVKGYINKSPRTIEVEEDANIELIVNTNPGETTPEYCFWIENNVIEYYHPGCGKDVNIPSTINGETVLGIGDYIFAEHGLTSVTLPNSLLAIGEGAFGANELKSIVIPNSVNDIGNYTFSGNNLESVVLPNNLTHIGYGTFSMNNITSINLPETLESIDSKAFEANIIYIPEYVEYVDNAIQEAIEYCLENPGSRGASNPQQCPQIIQQQIETMGGYKGVYVNILEASYGPEIFSEIMSPVKGYINKDPSTVQVAADANIELIWIYLEDCFTFEDGTILDYAETCPRDMVIPNTIGGTPVTRIGEQAFDAMELTSVLIPQGIIDIGTGAFFDNQIKTIILPAGLQELGAYAFYQNELENVSSSGPLALTEIKYETFANNYLTALGIPDGISIIGDGAFQNNNINTLTLPESLQIIGDSAFQNNSIKNITFPKNLTELGVSAFADNEIEIIYINEIPPLNKISASAFRNNKLTNGGVPGSITIIEDFAFAENLFQNLTIAEGVQQIGTGAFLDNNLSSIHLPDSIESIASGAFAGNPGVPKYAGKVEGSINKNPASVALAPNANLQWTYNYTVTFNSNGAANIPNQTINYGSQITPPAAPSKAGFDFAGWYSDAGLTQARDFATPVNSDLTLYAKWEKSFVPSDIQLTAEITAANQTVRINKYFSNAYTVNRGDGSTETVNTDKTHTYATAGDYTITLSLAGTASRWTFQNISKPLVPTAGTTATNIYLSSMPSLADYFGANATNPGDYFFYYFNFNGALTSLPEGSFNTSNITTAGNFFFSTFNRLGKLTSLPAGSFDTSKITTVGTRFFYYFNYGGALTTLPQGSFDTSNITTVGDSFFSMFNPDGNLIKTNTTGVAIKVPTSSTVYFHFKTPAGISSYQNIVGGSSFKYYAMGLYAVKFLDYDASLLDTQSVVHGDPATFPVVNKEEYSVGSWYQDSELTQVRNFDTPITADLTLYGKWEKNNIQLTAEITAANQTVKINKYFSNTYSVDRGDGSPIVTLTADTTHTYTAVGEYQITLSLTGTATRWTFGSIYKPLVPKAGTTANNIYLSSMPSLADYFGTSATSPGDYFFRYFNRGGALTSLPAGSFDTSNITTAGNYFFSYFNYNGALTSLPEGSFNTSNITTAGNYFFSHFNYNGALTTLPENSFNTSNITTAGNYFFASFNYYGALTSLPEGSFNTSNITTVGSSFFSYFNQGGALIRASNTGVAIKNPSSSAVTFHFKTPAGGSSSQSITAGSSFQYYATAIYTVSFTDHDGTVLATQSVGPGDPAIAPTDPTRAGYSFAGWYQDSELTQLWNFATPVTSDLTLYAKWLSSFTVSFESNGGSPVADQTVHYGNTINQPTAPTKAGYTFDGWYKESGLTNAWIFASDTMPANNITLYAKWNTVSYSINYQLDGGTNDPENPNTYTIETATITLKAPSKIGYTFDGWYDATTGGNKITSITKGSTGDKTLYARWTINQYEVTFNSNGGSVVAKQTLDYNSTVTAPTAPTKAGYTFDGWYKDENLTTAWDFATDRVPANNITLYAKWIVNIYTVTFKDHDATILKTEIVNHGSAATAPSDPTRVGYTFAGWDTPYNNIITNTIITATYTTNTYTITYNLDGGTNHANNPSSYTIETDTITLQNPTKLGYTFAGWYDAATGGNNITLITKGSTGDKILYARWTINQYDVTFNSNGGSAVAKQTLEYNATVSQPSTPSKEGHSFAGWYKDENLTTAWDFATDRMPANDLTLYAKWTVNSYELSFDSIGGSAVASKSVNYGTTTTAPTAPTKSNASFGGRYKDAGYTTAWSFATDTMPAHDLTLYAKWSYVVNFEVEGGSAVANQSIDHGKIAIRPANPTKTGYSFDNWYTTSEKLSLWNFATPITGKTTIYAKWNIINYTISYHLDGGTNDPENPNNYTIETATITLKTPSKLGYSFDGWYDAASGGNKITAITKGSTGNKTLYARWTINQYEVSFDTNGGTPIASQTIDYHSTITVPVDPIKEEFDFLGWYSDVGLTQVRDFTTPVTADLTLYAKWKQSFKPFISTWETTTANETITIYTQGVGYDYSIDWGDGTVENKTTANPSHRYTTPGIYTIKIRGNFPRLYLYGNSTMAKKIRSVEQWGEIEWTSMERAFQYAIDLSINASDAPQFNTVSGVSFVSMFDGVKNLTGNFNHWDTSKVTNMGYMFNSASNFNQPIGNWNVSNVTNMTYMFHNVKNFNQPIGDWDVSKVTSMQQMFSSASNFNQPIGNWDTSKVTNMYGMFSTSSFNQPIGDWDVSKVTDMGYMFYNAQNFNQNLNKRCVSAVVSKGYFSRWAPLLSIYHPRWGLCPNDYAKILNFDSMGGSSINTQVFGFGEKIDEPYPPLKEGYGFVGWYLEDNYLTKRDFEENTMPNQDLTLYAKWENDTYDSCFTVYRGEIQGYRYPLDAICGSDVIIPESIYGMEINSIGDYAFASHELSSVSISEHITSIGDHAFYNNQLTSITIPDSITNIGWGVFSDNQLTSIIIPNSVTQIGWLAFQNNQLNSISIPNSVTQIEGGAFQNNQLNSISIPNSIESIGGGTFANNQLTSISIPNSVTTIGWGAFQNNRLHSVNIPNSVVGIEAFAFANNHLNSLIIPQSVTYIDQYAFLNNIPFDASSLVGYSAWLNQNDQEENTGSYRTFLLEKSECSEYIGDGEESTIAATCWPTVTGYVTKDPSSIQVAENANINLSYSLSLTVYSIDEEGNKLIPDQIITTYSGENKFERGKSYTIKPAKLSNPVLQAEYLAPAAQKVSFMDGEEGNKEITFIYTKPRLLLHYDFNDESTSIVKDKSGNGHTGNIIGNIYRDDRGRDGASLEFNGTNSYIKIPNNQKLKTSNQMTVSSWIKIDEMNSDITLLERPNSYKIGICADISSLCANRNGKSPEGIQKSTQTLDLESRYLATITWDDEMINFYIDGNLINSIPSSGAGITWDTASHLFLGAGDNGSNKFKGSMDDIRIYNYALTPQKILALYESYPEEKGPHAKITLHTNQLTGILVNQKININIDTNIYANSKDFVLNIFIPNILVVNDYTFAPIKGISPLSGQIIKETTSTGINYKIPIKDRLIGTMSSSFILYFKTLETYHEQETTITANIEKRGKEVTQDNLTLKAWNNANLTFSIMTKPTTLGNDIDIEYIFTTQSNCSKPSSPNSFVRCDPEGAGLWDLEGVIPLPENAQFISTKSKLLSYDSEKHALIVALWKLNSTNYYKNRKTQFSAILKYSDAPTQIQLYGGDVAFSGLEGKIIPRSFVFSGIKASLSEPKIGFTSSVRSYQQYLIPDHTEQGLLSLAINNNGNTPLNNVAIKLELPTEWRANKIKTPPLYKIELFDRNGQLSIDYKTNFRVDINKILEANKTYDKAALGLIEGEYITELIFKFPHINPGGYIEHNGYYDTGGFRIEGDVSSKFEDGSLINHGDTATVKTTISSDEITQTSKDQKITYRSKSYVPTYLEYKTKDNKLSFNQGDTVTINSIMRIWNGYFYSNGHYLKNPSIFIFVPNGFSLQPESFKLSMSNKIGSSSAIQQIKPKDYVGNATIWKIDLEKEFNRAAGGNVNMTFDIQVDNDAIPRITYDFSQFMFVGSDNPKYQTAAIRGTTAIKDKFGVLGTINENNLVYPSYHGYKFDKLNVVASSFGVNTCLKTDKDLGCKGMYDELNPISRSNYSPNATGSYKATIYNSSSKDISNFKYNITIPNIGDKIDGYTVQWVPTLNQAIQVKNAPGTIIKYDGSTSFNPNAKNIEITIPTIKIGDLPEIITIFKANNFEEEDRYKRSYIQNKYQIGGEVGIYNAGVAGLRLVPADYDPEAEESYVFCLYPQLELENPNISINECRALIDLYRHTGGDSWRKRNGRNVATQVGANYLIHQQVFDVCAWDGISCENRKITKLDLSSNQLEGTLPNSFSHLRNLKTLNLSNNKLGENSLSVLTNGLLQSINLNNTQLTTVIPETIFSKNPNLLYLNLGYNKLQGNIPNVFGHVNHLDTLDLSNNQLQGLIPDSLTNLNYLKILLLNDNYLVGPLPSLDKIKDTINTIDIRNNYINNIKSINPMLTKNMDIISSLGQKITSLPQWQLIAAEKTSNLGYIVNNTIRNTSPERSYVLHIGKRNLDGYKRDGAPIYGNFKTFEDLGFIGIQSILPVKHTLQELGQVRVENISSTEIGSIIFSIQEENKNHPNESATFVQKLYPEGIDIEETGPSWTGDYNRYYGQENGLFFELESKYLRNSFSPVHFNIAGNDFGGGFFWTETTELATPVTIMTKKQSGEYEKKECHTRVNGFYYNSQRGERLRPLDETSLEQLRNSSIENSISYDKLEIDGGFFTNCRGDIYGIYGNITHQLEENNEIKEYKLNAGVSYDTLTNSMKSDGLKCNFQRLNNQYPFGYVYDENGHIGFVGAKINDPDGTDNNTLSCALENSCISDYFRYIDNKIDYNAGSAKCGATTLDGIDLEYGDGSAAETMFRLGIRGIIGLSRDTSEDTKQEIIGNTLQKSILMETEETIANIINVARKNAALLCRNKWNPTNTKDNVLCYNSESENGYPINLNLSNNNYAGKTIVVKGRDITISNSMKIEDKPIHIFIDQGNLYLQNPISTGNLQDFNAYGFPILSTDPSGAKANYLKGNFIINGLILGGNENNLTKMQNKRYINGKVASYNTYGEPDSKRITTLEYILTNWKESFQDYINLENIFLWKCDNPVQGIGSDGTPCKGIGASDEKGEMTSKAFGLIDFYYSNPLFK